METCTIIYANVSNILLFFELIRLATVVDFVFMQKAYLTGYMKCVLKKERCYVQVFGI